MAARDSPDLSLSLPSLPSDSEMSNGSGYSTATDGYGRPFSYANPLEGYFCPYELRTTFLVVFLEGIPHVREPRFLTLDKYWMPDPPEAGNRPLHTPLTAEERKETFNLRYAQENRPGLFHPHARLFGRVQGCE